MVVVGLRVVVGLATSASGRGVRVVVVVLRAVIVVREEHAHAALAREPAAHARGAALVVLVLRGVGEGGVGAGWVGGRREGRVECGGCGGQARAGTAGARGAAGPRAARSGGGAWDDMVCLWWKGGRI